MEEICIQKIIVGIHNQEFQCKTIDLTFTISQINKNK